jgi:hypothetical protein
MGRQDKCTQFTFKNLIRTLWKHIKIDIKKREFENVNWAEETQDGAQKLVLVTTLMKLQGS